MDIVHSRHLSFLEQQDSISRDLFTELANTYERDYTLHRQTFASMVQLLCDKYAENQWDLYECKGNKPSCWHTCNLNGKMESVYVAHSVWMESVTSIDHTSHEKWMKTYASDPIMDYGWKFCFISIMDANLRRYIESTDDAIVNGSPQHAALKYYQDKEDIDIEPNRFTIPYYLW